ncbi:DUF6499 domain-containing protein [Bradyrhizobium barranii]|uniref:DUF6499 domain-containing protein n=1 Tax=Bradyrhizobium barranii TaxID=2992140 RepID=A0ABY3QZ42_9BRAD|nr:DUF6499 domain-containing protein [Bradyrhizobium japonicum]UFW91117.1 DUF6499 domain-containing protein [Bradyrhizobium japonicum]
MADFAWESLRRSPIYRASYRKNRSEMSSGFRRRWGVCFRS